MAISCLGGGGWVGTRMRVGGKDKFIL